MDKPEKRKLDTNTPTARDEKDSPSTAEKRRKVIGPSLPPPAGRIEDDNDNTTPNSDDDDDDDDDFGPSLPPPVGASISKPSIASTTAAQNQSEAKSAPQPQRDAWMLLPPSADDRSSRMDPTKLRSRKFQTGRSAGSSAPGGVDSIWTETPEQKMRRLQNEAMGITVGSSGSSGGGEGVSAQEAKKSRAMREKIERYNEQKRKEDAAAQGGEGRSKKDEEEEDDPSARAFDKEKDMALGSKLTHAQRREMISKASDFGSRFTTGKFL
ncbi:hypothetical protein P175DRAFT_0475764 [Aspergillus ochraceoroseus IBT 24754]|uniref:DUF3752 domain-containing protein n=2 Tax=Aspergillus ochraceoroseus TaxID=138278 RepID=A0A2T5M4H3_9EURO|nr:uncharacterized protein P175DRAFT_0475764 [Aspergillus ochraceoroseus IBT 24754]KKK17828.1 hypothetical protein AOCH_003818 [Aspergillus ochraceoroseus]PTU23437.1 hypothetical protein P175DRAFT_0475764 [Aspergillus ochraceoroseus IBT 24754]